jgi:hypothetical protein
MAQRIVNGEQYEAMLIGGDLDGSPLDVEGQVSVDKLQASSAFAITPSNTTDLSVVTSALYVGFTGNISVICSGDTEFVTFFNVPGGSFLPLHVKRVVSSGTTASGIVGVV